MEENGDKFELKDGKKTYKITLKNIICVVLIIVIFVSIVSYIAFKTYYEAKRNLNENNLELDQVIEDLESSNTNRVSQEKTDDDFEEEVNYDYSDFLNNTDEEIYNEEYSEYDYYDDYYYEDYEYDEYNKDEACRYNAEYALQFIYTLKANPLYLMSNEMSGYSLLKNLERKEDGSYNINIAFEELSEIVYFYGFHPSCLKTNEDLKNNINILSQNQINIKDTGIVYDYCTTSLSFDKIENNKYTGYFYIEEYKEDDYSSIKYVQATVEFNQNDLITNIEYKEVPKESVPEELTYDDTYYDYDYSYSDYISQ